MSIELILASFNDTSDAEERRMQVLRMGTAVREVLRKLTSNDVGNRFSDEEFQVDLPGGTAQINANVAIFPIVELDPVTLEVIFEVARAGNLVMLTEGGKYSAILVDPDQRSLLPYDEWKTQDASPVCRSAAELAQLLESWYRELSEYRGRTVERFENSDGASRSASKQHGNEH